VSAALRAHSIADDGSGGNFTTSFSAADQDVILVFVGVYRDTTLTSVTDDHGGTYTILTSATWSDFAGNNKIAAAVRDTKVSGAVTLQITAHMSSPPASSIGVLAYSGMLREGADAIRSSGQTNDAAAVTPAPPFGATTLATSLLASCVAIQRTGGVGIGAGSGFTSLYDHDDSPNWGSSKVETSTGTLTITTAPWGGGAPYAFGALAVEIDTTAPTNTATLDKTFGDIVCTGTMTAVDNGKCTLDQTLGTISCQGRAFAGTGADSYLWSSLGTIACEGTVTQTSPPLDWPATGGRETIDLDRLTFTIPK
jgi:hypothetical protein